MYGIDYGTYCSSICKYDINIGAPVPLPIFGTEEFLLRSAITKKSDYVVVGYLDSTGTESSISPKRQLELNNEKAVMESYHLLNKLREATGEKQISAVVTIPVNYNSSQREATRQACQMAGINVMRFISEPTAIALAQRNMGERAIILDIGGGTTDISLVEYDKETNLYEVIKSGGDSVLGGEDVNKSLYNYLNTEHEYMSVYRQIENAKKTICDVNMVIICGQLVNQELFKQLANDFYKKIDSLLDGFLEEGTPIFLAGGSSKLLGLKEYLANQHPEVIFQSTETPEFLVSKGACLFANSLCGNEITLLDIVPLSLGVADYQDNFIPIISKGSALPISVSKLFTLSEDSEKLCIKVYQGERSICTDNFFLGEVSVQFKEVLKRNQPKLEVKFTLDVNSILHIAVSEKSTDFIFVSYITKDKLVADTEAIEKMLKQAEMMKQADEIKQEEGRLINKLFDIICIIESRGFDCQEYKDRTSGNYDLTYLRQLIDELASKYPFALVANNVNPNEDERFCVVDLKDETISVIEEKIKAIKTTIAATDTVEATLTHVAEELATEEPDYAYIKLVLDDLLFNKHSEYENLVLSLKENITDLGLTKENQDLLLKYIDKLSQSKQSYSDMIEHLNDFCRILIENQCT